MKKILLIIGFLLFLVINTHAQTTEEFFNRGFAKGNHGNYQGALEDFNKAIELDPNFALAYVGRGNAKAELGDKSGAIQDYNKAIELNPNFAWAYNIRGYAKYQLGDKSGACLDWSKAVELGSMDAYDLIKENCK